MNNNGIRNDPRHKRFVLPADGLLALSIFAWLREPGGGGDVPGSGLAIDTSLRKIQSQQVSHPVDVEFTIIDFKQEYKL